MKKFIKNLIGYLTAPTNLYVDIKGDNWIWYDIENYPHPFSYQRVYQTYWGFWKEDTMYLHVHRKLTLVSELVSI